MSIVKCTDKKKQKEYKLSLRKVCVTVCWHLFVGVIVCWHL